MKITQSTIHLEEMTFYAYHGVLPQERTVGAYYTVSLSLRVRDIALAIEEDTLQSTVNYAEVYRFVTEEMAIPSNLLEHVAGRILKKLFLKFSLIDIATIKLSKQYPPITGAKMQYATIELTAEREI